MKNRIHYSVRRGLAMSMSKGFTLIELLITVAISIIMTGVVVTNYRDYTINAYFANASEDIVLALRHTQVYGVGGKTNTVACVSGESLSKCRYGVHFSTESGYSDGLILFVDNNNDRVFNSGEDVETIKWKGSIVITDLMCGTSGCAGGLDVTFMRPSPDALIVGTLSPLASYVSAKITISNGMTPSRSTVVTINNTGQISLQRI